MAGGYRCSSGHVWTPSIDSPQPQLCPVCGDTVVMAHDPTAEAGVHRPAFVVAVSPDHPDPGGKDATLPPDPRLAAIPAIDSPTVTLGPKPAAEDMPTRDDVSFSSLVGMPKSRPPVNGAEFGSVVPFGEGKEGTIDYTPPPTVPGYEILHEVGRGGMGVVYKAMQIGLNRPVALKMILAGVHAGPRERDRFRREAEAVATLQNPYIVQIFDIGEASGHLFLALEFIDGGSLAQHLRTSPWSATDAAELVELLARAVHYAHRQGVVHRDLKPGNILLSAERATRNAEPKTESADDKATIRAAPRTPRSAYPKITDFGLAKRIGDSGNPDGTKTGAVMGTPSYIAPEQASGKARDVGPAADVYSLGAILYEMLTGRPPFLGETPLETVLQVLHDDPVPPKRLQPSVPRDLETICLKCLNKSEAKRYATAEALADDLHRFTKGEPIKARPLSSWGRAVKWAKRHPSLAILGSVTMAALVALVVGLAIAYKHVSDAVDQREIALAKEAGERQRAENLAADNEKKRQVAAELAKENEERRIAAVKHNEELSRQIEERKLAAYALQLAQVAALCERDPRRAAMLLEDESRCPKNLRDFTWYYLHRLCRRTEMVYLEHMAREPQQAADPIRAVAFSPALTFVATAGQSGHVRVWDPRTGFTWATLGGHRGGVRGVAFSPDGEVIATAAADGTIRLWELPVAMLDGARQTLNFVPVIRPLVKPLALVPTLVYVGAHTSEVNCIAFSPDGRRLVSGGEDGALKWWDLAAWRTTLPDVAIAGGPAATGVMLAQAANAPRPIGLTREVHAHIKDRKPQAIKSLAFSASGNVLVSGGADHVARVWVGDGANLIRTITNHDDAVVAVAASPDGRLIATVNNGSAPTVRLITLDTGRDQRRLVGHTQSIYALAFSPDGELIASAGFDRSLRVWDTDGQERTVLYGHDLAISALAFAPDRRTIVSAGMDGIARVWQTTARQHETLPFSRDGPLAAATISPGRIPTDGATYVGGDDRGRVSVSRSDMWPRSRDSQFFLTPVVVTPPPPPRTPIRAVASAPDGSLVLASTSDRLFAWHRLPGSRSGFALLRPTSIRTPHPIYAMTVDPTGRWLAMVDQEGVIIWDMHSLPLLLDRPERLDRPFDPKGPGRILPIGEAREVAFHPQGDLLAVAIGNGVRIIDRKGKKLADVPAAHEAPVEAVAFGGKDGSLLATGDTAGIINVYRVGKTGQLTFLTRLTGHTGAVYALAFSPDGKTLASGGNDRTLVLWDPVSGQERAVLTGHTDRILRVQFLPDSSALLSVARDGAVKRWRAETAGQSVTPREPAIGE